MSDIYQKSLELHKKYKGKLHTESIAKIENSDDLSWAYSPGVAEPCREIEKDEGKMYDYTLKSRTVAVISDGSAVLGLGNIGHKASLPVMEGKCVLFREFAGVDAFPIIVDTQDTEEFITTVKRIADTFGGINLEDISAPRCFEIEERLKSELDIPVMHDDQHGTAIVTLAGLINALKITGKKKEDIKVVLSGAGAAGVAIAKLLKLYGVGHFIACDSRGIIHSGRENLDISKQKLLEFTNEDDISGSLEDAIKDADVFVGVSAGGILSKQMVESMKKDPIIFAMANPTPEIMPELAKEAGARIIGTGRSDYPNQINNVLAFPGIFKGVLKYHKKIITDTMKIRAAEAIASCVKNPTPDEVIPNPFDKSVAEVVAEAMKGE
ncbi:NAD-dependent malic enzyme [Candidatus Gracilibacteria bacterium]|nr:MAG: NAD-dependent malic enzyme [Candidatus Gracilibacteria bacterium]